MNIDVAIHIRYIGEAQMEWARRNGQTSHTPGGPLLAQAQVGDAITHPDFPDRLLFVKARHIDLTEPGMTLFLDLLPEHQLPNGMPDNVFPLRRHDGADAA